MFMLVQCVDRCILKNGVYLTHEEAYQAMLLRVAALTGKHPAPDANGYADITEGGKGGVHYNWAWLDDPINGGYHYDWAILEV